MTESLAAELRVTLSSSTVLTPDSEGYAESIIRWSDAVEKKAGIVVYVGSAEDISKTVLLSRKHGISFVVCGGKHSSGGASSSEGGLVIDLGKMRNVSVDPVTKIVRAQGGCIWEDVDFGAADYGLAMVGGTVNHTGVGGLTLGGGYGWLSGRYGLTIDCLLEVEIVLADGTIARASATQHPDLFWAVRGAGHCFGVVSEFVFQAHDQKNEVWSGQVVFGFEKLDSILDFANNLVATTDGDSAMIMNITAPPFMPGPSVVATVFHNGPESRGTEIFKPLLEAGPVRNSTRQRSYREVNSMLNPLVDYGGRKLSKGAPFLTPLSPELVRSLAEDLEQLHATVPGSRKTILNFEFFKPDVWCSVPPHATAFSNRGAHQNLLIGPFWESAANDDDCRAWARHISAKVKAHVEQELKARGGMHTGIVGEYGNYDHLVADPREVFNGNLQRLARIKAKYDPDNVFDKSYNLRA